MDNMTYLVDFVSTTGMFVVNLYKSGEWNGTMYLHNIPADFGYNVHRIIEVIDQSGYMPESPIDNELLNQAYFLFGGV